MTDAEIDALEAGFALDLKVAKACGIECLCSTPVDKHYEPTGEPASLVVNDGNGATKPFRPSSDWNDAMFAADKSGLFDGHQYLLKNDGKWVVWPWFTVGLGVGNAGFAESGPVAVCRAILRNIK